jgi:nucleotide-binding universal stress UspA family protein
MTAPQKILVGVDFSPESDAAIRHALGVARATGAEVVLLHACTIPQAPAVLGDFQPPAMEDYRARLEADLAADRRQLDVVAAALAAEGVKVSQTVADGFPDVTITALGEQIGADLTVVGTHGRTGVKWLFLGSVAQRVIRLSHGNVLVARGEARPGGYRRICVGTDFSPIADRSLEAALDLAGLGAEVDVVHVWNLAPRLGFYEPIRMASLDSWRGALDEEIGRSGERLLADHRRPGITLGFEARFEPVLPGLLEHIDRGRYDLAVLGSHGRRGFRRFVLGSVAEETARRASCAVLVVHGGEGEGAEATS